MATVKCPNCFQENPAENRFCMFCATPLHEAAAPVYSPSAASVKRCPNGHPVNETDLITGFCSVCGQTLVSDDAPAPEPVAHDEPAAPVTHYVPPVPVPASEPSFSYEPVTPEPASDPEPVFDEGIVMTAEPEPEPAPAPSVPAVRVCAVCGTTVEDPLLRSCPRCGSMLDAEIEPPRPAVAPPPAGWTCASCGTLNNPDYAFCQACGKPHREAPAPRTSAEPASSLLEGMRLPGDDDLRVRRKYGN